MCQTTENHNHTKNEEDEMKTSYYNLLSSDIKSKLNKISEDAGHIGQLTKQIAVDDPRRVVHSIKVAFAITVVSLFYYFDPLYQGFGVNAMWAVLTVVVVFEFSVGATLGKGVNRILATVLGGMCGAGAHKLASLSGKILEPVFIGLSVFIIAGVTTFIRFYPKMKAKFDYGLLIFILTFCLISVSGYREEEVIDMAHRRMTTIMIGSSTAVIICVLIWPVWAGTDLHNLVTTHLEELGDFLHDFGVEYFKTDSTSEDDEIIVCSRDRFKGILDSKSNVDILVNFAKWEPRHGPFKYHHPWMQYQKINELTRRCACRTEALHAFLDSHIQVPSEVKTKLEEPCTKISKESGKALKELSISISTMRRSSMSKTHIQNAIRASQELDQLLNSSTLLRSSTTNLNLSSITPTTTVAALLVEILSNIEEIEVAVQELATLAKFKDKSVGDGHKKGGVAPDKFAKHSFKKLNDQGSIKKRSFNNHVIVIEGSSPRLSSRFSSKSQFHDPPSLAISHNSVE